MVQVKGVVHDVSDNPDRVDRIVVRAEEPRMQGSTYVTEEPAYFTVVDGVLDFNVLPGPCVVAFLRNHGATTYEKLLVPDKTTATLAECIEAANLATDGTRNALERLALEIQAELGQVPSLVTDALAQDSTIIEAVQQVSVAREDTTVGTRLFLGEHMIYGDTGAVYLARWDQNGNVTEGKMPEGVVPQEDSPGFISLRRNMNVVTLEMSGLVIESGISYMKIGEGYRNEGYTTPFQVLPANVTATHSETGTNIGVDDAFLYGVGYMIFMVANSPGAAIPGMSNTSAKATWFTADPWPTP